MTLKRKLLVYLLSLFSFMGVVPLFLIKNKVTILPHSASSLWSYAIYVLIPLLLTLLSVWLIERMPRNETLIINGNDIVPVEGNLIPAYIGMFVISLSLPGMSIESFMIMLLLLVIWLNIGSVSYFNPFLSIIGYRFYAVRSINNKSITLITSKKDLKQASKLRNLIRVNNYTFFWSEK
ncbi:MAG TPA: hypothetical protein VMW10_01690 [Alphaproteobacteria bacterium]|nr:hypothetical protein [Alphaproteobacteria bacterium]